MGVAGLGGTLPAEGSLPFETLLLGTHKGHPYSGQADRGEGQIPQRTWE